MSASGKASAWAVGGTDLSHAAGGAPVAERWNGKSWHAATLPSGLTGALGAVSTPSQTDAWTVSQLTGYVLCWNGTKWSVAKKFKEPPLAKELTGVTAFSPTSVWVFGAPGANPGFGTWHLSGTTWHQVTGTWSSHALPTGAGQAFGIAAIPGTTSLWSSGYLETGGDTGSDAVIWGHGPAA